MEDINTSEEAIKLLSEACDFLNEVEDELENKVDGEITGKIETAYLEIDEVIGFLSRLTKEK